MRGLLFPLLLKLIFRQLIPLAREHIFLEAWGEVTVMPLNHADLCAHLYGKRMYIHPVVE